MDQVIEQINDFFSILVSPLVEYSFINDLWPFTVAAATLGLFIPAFCFIIKRVF